MTKDKPSFPFAILMIVNEKLKHRHRAVLKSAKCLNPIKRSILPNDTGHFVVYEAIALPCPNFSATRLKYTEVSAFPTLL